MAVGRVLAVAVVAAASAIFTTATAEPGAAFETRLSPTDFSATPAGEGAKSTHAHLEPFGSYEAGGEGVGALAEGAWLVKFYTEKCGHCRRLQPSWEALGGRDAEERGYSLGSLDCKASDEHLDACAKMRPGWQGHGWPAVVVMMNGRVLGGMKRYSRIRDVEPQQGAKILDAFVQRALGKPLDSQGRKLLRLHFAEVPGKEFIPDCEDGCGGARDDAAPSEASRSKGTLTTTAEHG